MTEPCLDFAKMRQNVEKVVGSKVQGDLLLLLEKLDKDLQLQVEAALDEVEEEGRHRLAFQRGLLELLQLLDDCDVKRAIVTRNSTRSIEHLLECLQEKDERLANGFSVLLSREFKPHKPDPSSAIFIGDSADDMLCGAQAGNVTCLLRSDLHGTHGQSRLDAIQDLIQLRISCLSELNDHLFLPSRE